MCIYRDKILCRSALLKLECNQYYSTDERV